MHFTTVKCSVGPQPLSTDYGKSYSEAISIIAYLCNNIISRHETLSWEGEVPDDSEGRGQILRDLSTLSFLGISSQGGKNYGRGGGGGISGRLAGVDLANYVTIALQQVNRRRGRKPRERSGQRPQASRGSGGMLPRKFLKFRASEMHSGAF